MTNLQKISYVMKNIITRIGLEFEDNNFESNYSRANWLGITLWST